MVVVVYYLLVRVGRLRQHVLALLLRTLLGASERVKSLICSYSRGATFLLIKVDGSRLRRGQPHLLLVVVIILFVALGRVIKVFILKLVG